MAGAAEGGGALPSGGADAPSTPARLGLEMVPQTPPHHPRPSSAASSRAGWGAELRRTGYDASMMAMLRRQQEAFEQKVLGQLGQARMQSDRIREAALARMEERLCSLEGAQARASRGLAELNGKLRGVSDEMQAQLRRVDAVEGRFGESRREIEDGLRNRHAELEKDIKKVAKDVSECHAAQERQHQAQQQKHQRLGDDLFSHRRDTELLSGRLEDLEAKIHEVAQAKIDEIDLALRAADVPAAGGWPTTPPPAVEEPASAAHLGIVEKRVADLARKYDEVMQDSAELHARLATQDQQLSAANLKVESREESWRELKDRVDRGDWEGRIEQLRRGLQDEARQAGDAAEQVTRLARRLEGVEQVQEQLEGRLASARSRPADEDRAASGAQELLLQVQEMRDVVGALRERADLVESAQDQLRERLDAGPRVDNLDGLVEQLKEVVPKIVDQEQRLQDLDPKVGALQAILEGFGPSWHPATAEDLERLGREVQRLAEAEARAQALSKALEARIDELGNPAELRGDIESLQKDLGQLKTQGAGSADLLGDVDLRLLKAQPAQLTELRGDVESLHADLRLLKAQPVQSTELRGDVESLRAALEELRSSSSKASAAAELGGERQQRLVDELDALKGEVGRIAERQSTLCTQSPQPVLSEASELRRDLDATRAAVAKLEAASVGCVAGAALKAEDQQMLENLLRVAQGDEEAESEAHGRLLEALDRFCVKLAAAEKAL